MEIKFQTPHAIDATNALADFHTGITHHLGDLKTSDDVIYLDAGHIVEHGSFDELMKAKGTFYQQVNARGDE